jgi:hypothetical protein
MGTALRVRLTPALKREAAFDAPPLLDPRGPLVSIGGASGNGLTMPVKADAMSLFGPRGACLIAPDGPLWVSDTGHHRLLGWARLPAHEQTPADWIVGHADFVHEGRNAKGIVGSTTLNVPTGITPCGDGLAVADAWNHRVLIWSAVPDASHAPADLVLGQQDLAAAEPNRGEAAPSAASLFWPYGVYSDGKLLAVADAGNRRVLIWNRLPERNGQPADIVLGQRDFISRDENGGGEPSAHSMRWPHGVTLWMGKFCMADAGNNRIMIWDRVPSENNTPCDHVLGQPDARHVDHNQSRYWPDAATLNMPYAVTAAGPWLLAADTANSRLLGWHIDDARTGAPARALTGQPDFHAKGDNRWQLPSHDSLCWPYAVMHCSGSVVIGDSGNNRVSVWRPARDLSL